MQNYYNILNNKFKLVKWEIKTSIQKVFVSPVAVCRVCDLNVIKLKNVIILQN